MSVTITSFNKFQKPLVGQGLIIADHTIVADYENIPQQYIDDVKKMWVVIAGESHSQAVRDGLTALETSDATYAVSVVESGTPDAYTTSNLRASRATWGDYSHSSTWIYDYGEEDWWSNATAVSRTQNGIAYCNSNSLTISAIGFGWCWDAMGGGPADHVDAEHNDVHWYGACSLGDGQTYLSCWGLDEADEALTDTVVCLDTYLTSTQAISDYCTTNNIPTKVYFTTGPVDTWDGTYGTEAMYQAYLKYQRIRDYVNAQDNAILFDYADILCYDDNGTPTTGSWSGHSYPLITTTNLGDTLVGHIGAAGALRLAKAMWWMLARIAGWDGN